MIIMIIIIIIPVSSLATWFLQIELMSVISQLNVLVFSFFFFKINNRIWGMYFLHVFRLCFIFLFLFFCDSCAVEMICITTNCKYPRHVLCVVISSLVHKYQRFNSFKLHSLCSLFTREAPAGLFQLFWPDFWLFKILLFCLFVWIHSLSSTRSPVFPCRQKQWSPEQN